MIENDQDNLETKKKPQFAMFAGGCFWCMVPSFQSAKGVLETVVGYSGGDVENPTYEQVTQGNTGHREVIHIAFDPSQISFSDLLEIYWRQIDPTDESGQFADRGESYRAAIYYYDEEQKVAAIQSKDALSRSGKFERPVLTEILPANSFYPAEDYHQDYHRKNPIHYKKYKEGSGRAPYLRQHWPE